MVVVNFKIELELEDIDEERGNVLAYFIEKLVTDAPREQIAKSLVRGAFLQTDQIESIKPMWDALDDVGVEYVGVAE